MDEMPRSVTLQTGAASLDLTVVETTSSPFVGRWNRLVSSTNWEKGRIIVQWRAALMQAGAPVSEYSDEAWSRRVGMVTGQHAGRLRRVFERFGQANEEYPGLYWSHFQAALDWSDAEMWLEGAVQNRWSVSQMRHQRGDTLGGLENQRTQDEQYLNGALDEDFEPAVHDLPSESEANPGKHVDLGPREEGPDFGDAEDPTTGHSTAEPGTAVYAEDVGESTVEFVRPFADLKDLPEDLAEAFEAFKLAILRHKMNDWQEILREDVLASLEALRQLVWAPSAADAVDG